MKKYLLPSNKLFCGLTLMILITLLTFQQASSQTTPKYFLSGDYTSPNSWSSSANMVQTGSSGTYYHLTQPNLTGNKYFRLYGDATTYSPSNSAADFLYSTGSEVALQQGDGSKAFYISATISRYYLFKTFGVAASAKMVITDCGTTVPQLPTTATVATNYSSRYPIGRDVIVSCTLATNITSAQSLILRYSVGGTYSSNGVLVTMTNVSGNIWQGTIPLAVNTAGATISYYMYTTHATGPAQSNANADNYAWSLINNSGSNYSYTVVSSHLFNGSTVSYATAASWADGFVPTSGPVTIAATCSLASGAAVTMSQLNINNGITFTARNTGSTKITFDGFSNSSTLINTNTSGVFAVGSASSQTIVVKPQTTNMTVTMSNRAIGLGIDSIGSRSGASWGTIGVDMSNVTIGSGGQLVISSFGYVNTTPPTYNAASTLTYHLYPANGSSSYTVASEWTAGASSGAGYPGNVTIINGQVYLPSNTASNYFIAGICSTQNNSGSGTNGQFYMNGSSGSVTIGSNFVNNGGLTLSSNSSNQLIITGNFTQGAATNFNNSTFRLSGNYSITGGSVANTNATVEFTGSANTSISVPGGIGSVSFPKVNFNKTSTGTFTFTVGASSTVTVPGLTVSTNTNTVTSSLFQIASGGFLTRIAGTLTGTPNFLGTTDVTYSGSTACTTGVEMPASANINSVSVSNSGGVTLGAGVVMTSGKTFTIASGGVLNPGANAISGAGNFTMSGGTLNVSDASGIATNITVSGSRTWTSGTIAFTGSGTQAMGIGSNTLNTMGVSVNGTTNTLTFDPTSAATIASLSISSGCTFNLNAKTLTISTVSNATTLTNSGTFTHGNGKVIFAGSGVVHTVSGTLNFLDVDITPTSGLLGVNFGTGSTIFNSGTLTLTSGSYVSTNAPVYASGSLLRYSNASTFDQSSEWNNAPSNVQISNITSFQTATNAGSPKTINGNLTIDAGSTFTMAANSTSSAITVGGKVIVNGTLTLSSTIGGDLNVGDSLIFNTGSTFNGNTREVTFNGTGAQCISGTISSLPNFQFVQVNKASGTFTFTKPIPMNNGASTARFRITAGTVNLNAQGFTFGGAGAKQLRIDAGTLTTSGSSLTGFTEFTNTGTVSSLLNGTINFNGSGAETLPACGMNNVNLMTSGVKSLSANSAIVGTFSIAGTATVGGAFSLVYGSGAGLSIGSSANLTTADSFFPSSNGPSVLTISTTNSAAVTLHASRTVSTTFNFTSGDLNTGANTLTLGTSSASTGTLNVSGSSAIIGNFKRFIAASATSYVFPVGISGTRRSSTINFTSAPSAGGSLTATFVASAPSSTGLPLTEGAINVGIVATAGYWTVSAADGLTGGTYTSSFTGTGFAGISDFTKLVLVKRANSGSSWTLAGTHVTTTGSNATPVLSRTGVTGFSDFAIGGNVTDNPLPVTLLSFNASRNGSTVALKWTTACEVNNNYFLIQRSLDGKAFTTINKTIGNGTSCKGFGYTAFDANAPETVAYYKLVQVDYNGATTEFPVVKVSALGEKANNWMISISPNPGNGNVQLISNSLTDLVAIKITGTKGNLVETITGNGSLELNLSQSLSTLNSGYYLLQFVNAEGMTKVIRYVKE